MDSVRADFHIHISNRAFCYTKERLITLSQRNVHGIPISITHRRENPGKRSVHVWVVRFYWLALHVGRGLPVLLPVRRGLSFSHHRCSGQCSSQYHRRNWLAAGPEVWLHRGAVCSWLLYLCLGGNFRDGLSSTATLSSGNTHPTSHGNDRGGFSGLLPMVVARIVSLKK